MNYTRIKWNDNRRTLLYPVNNSSDARRIRRVVRWYLGIRAGWWISDRRMKDICHLAFKSKGVKTEDIINRLNNPPYL